MVIVALLVLGLQHGRGRAERFLGWLGRKLHFDPETASKALRQIGSYPITLRLHTEVETSITVVIEEEKAA